MIQINLLESRVQPFQPKALIKNCSLILTGILILGLCFQMVLNPGWRLKIRSYFMPPHRVVLSVLRADLDGKGRMANILKVKTENGLFLEVYGEADSQRGGLQPMLASIRLPDKRDGYFTFNGAVTNLAVDDIDNDKIPEILATSFDENMVAHLNIYRFNTASSSLIKINQTDGNNITNSGL